MRVQGESALRLLEGRAGHVAAERLVRGQWLRDEGDLVRVRVRVRVLVTLTLTLTRAMRKATSSLIGVSAVSSTTHRVSETCVKAVEGTIVWPGTKQQNDMRAAQEVSVSRELRQACVRARVQTDKTLLELGGGSTGRVGDKRI